MKKILVIAVALFGSPLLFAQTNGSSNLSEALKQYANCHRNTDVPCMLDYMWPEIFEVQDRESIGDGLQSTFADGFVKFDTVWCGKPVLLKKFETKQYALVPYSMNVSMSLEALGAKAEEANLVVETFSEQYGKENVKLSADKKFVLVSPQGQYIVARQMAPNENWYVLAYNQARMMLTESLPSEFAAEADPIVDPTGEMFKVEPELEESAEYAMPDTFVVGEQAPVETPTPKSAPKTPAPKPATKKVSAPKAAATKPKK
ncbi:MAG: hypothetical protein RL660_2176 [Bacteroidota bacterium]|jgi:hypothetical protein